jgi:hypothetical protein
MAVAGSPGRFHVRVTRKETSAAAISRVFTVPAILVER